MFVSVPRPGTDPRALAFRCATEAAASVGAIALASQWPRAGLFALWEQGRGAVSLTHSAQLVAAIATVGHCVGIDAEPCDREASAVRRILAPGEGAVLFAAAEAAGFPPAIATWCAKEAVGKALGTGLTNSDRWTLIPTKELGLWTLEKPERLTVRLARYENSLLAVALPHEKTAQSIEITLL